MHRVSLKFLSALLVLTPILNTTPAKAQLPSGSVLVVDSTAGTSQLGALFVVNPANGQRTLLSDFGNSSKGPLGVDPESITWVPATLLGPQSTILVVDGSAGTNGFGALFAVDPTSGQRTLVTDFGNAAQGPLGLYPVSVTVAPAILGLGGSILVLDAYAGTNGQGALFSINPANGQRTLVSDFGITDQGPAGVYPDSLTVSPGLLDLGPTLLVTDGSAGTGGLGAVFSINPTSGQRTVISDFGDTGEGPVDPDLNSFPDGIALQPAGLLGLTPNLLVLDSAAGTSKDGALETINPANGQRTTLSDFGNSAQGPLGKLVDAVALSGSNILVLDGGAGTNGDGDLFIVNPTTGHRTVLSDFGNSSQGPIGSYPTALAIIP